MIVRETVSFADIDWAMGQDAATTTTTTVPATTTTVVAPAPAPVAPAVPAPVLTPIVSLGPVRVMSRSGQTPYGIRATIRTPYRVIRDMEVPAGLFQAVIPKADFDAGATVIFGSSSHGSIEVPAVRFICAIGFQDQYGVLSQMSTVNCPFINQYFPEPVAPPRPAPAYRPAPPRRPAAPVRRRPQEAPEPEAEAESAPSIAPTLAPTTTDGMSPLQIAGIVGGGVVVLLLGYMALKS